MADSIIKDKASSHAALVHDGVAVSADIDTPLEVPPPVNERYYPTRRFATNMKDGCDEDFCVMKHSNHLIVVCMAPSHPFLKNAKDNDVKIQLSAPQAVKGKRKRGAQWLNVYSRLGSVTAGEASYNLYSCVRGSLFEVNQNIVDNPKLLFEKPLSDGYLAIINPKRDELDTCLDHLKTEDEYKQSKAAKHVAEPSEKLSEKPSGELTDVELTDVPADNP